MVLGFRLEVDGKVCAALLGRFHQTAGVFDCLLVEVAPADEKVLHPEGVVVGGSVFVLFLHFPVEGGDLRADVFGMLQPQASVGGKELQQGNALLLDLVGDDFGHYVDHILLVQGELRFGVEEADGLHAVAVQLYTVWVFFRIREDVEDAAAPGELAGLEDKVLLQILELVKLVQETVNSDFALLGDREGVVEEKLLGDDFLGHGLGIGDDAVGHLGVVGDLVDDFGAEFHVGVVDLVGGVGTLVGGGQVVHPLAGQRQFLVVEQLLQVVVEIGGPLAVGEYEKLRGSGLLCKTRGQQCVRGTRQTIELYGLGGSFRVQYRDDFRHFLGAEARLEIFYGHIKK